MNPTRKHRRILALAAAVALALPMSACSIGGSDAPEPVASLDNVVGQNTQITLDAGFVAALTSLKLTPGTFGTAKITDGAAIFPITGGNVTIFKPGEVSPYVIGQLQHEGSGLTLAAGATKVRLSNFNVDPGVSRVYGDVHLNGKPVVSSAFLFQLNGNTLNPLQTEGATAVLEGTQVKISPVAAGLLNKVFKTDAVAGGLLVGIAKITVNTDSPE